MTAESAKLQVLIRAISAMESYKRIKPQLDEIYKDFDMALGLAEEVPNFAAQLGPVTTEIEKLTRVTVEHPVLAMLALRRKAKEFEHLFGQFSNFNGSDECANIIGKITGDTRLAVECIALEISEPKPRKGPRSGKAGSKRSTKKRGSNVIK